MLKHVVSHSTHHKTGTVLFQKILKGISKQFNMPMYECDGKNYKSQAFYKQLVPNSLCLDNHSRIQLGMLNAPYRGTHMVRDPREVIISGYFYHLTTTEEWCLVPNPKLDGMSYQQYINSVGEEQGILHEMKSIGANTIREMTNWDYSNPNILELRFEDVQADFDAYFEQIFEFYGFPKSTIDTCLNIARAQDLSRMPKEAIAKNSHITNKERQEAKWKTIFTPKHKKYFKDHYGELLVRLGYEDNLNW